MPIPLCLYPYAYTLISISLHPYPFIYIFITISLYLYRYIYTPLTEPLQSKKISLLPNLYPVEEPLRLSIGLPKLKGVGELFAEPF